MSQKDAEIQRLQQELELHTSEAADAVATLEARRSRVPPPPPPAPGGKSRHVSQGKFVSVGGSHAAEERLD